MFRLFILLILLLPVSFLNGQPIITSESLPKFGDTILMASDNLPENIAILKKGGNQNWDLMGLQSAFTQKQKIQPVANSKKPQPFKKANLVIESVNGHQSFFQKTGNTIYLLGSNGKDPMNIGVETTTRYKNPVLSMKYPLKYGDSSTITGEYAFKVAIFDLPREKMYTLPITPDSIRYRCIFTQNKKVDAWGTLSLPDNNYEVLREKIIEEKEYRVDVKIGNLPWQDITSSVDDPLIQKKHLNYSYHFHSNETNSKVAVAYMKENQVNPKAVYYTVSDPSSTMRTADGRPDVYAYPNPAINEVRFEFSNLKPNTYALKIYNILGMVVRQENYNLNGFNTVKLDISKLRKGTYLYNLTDAKGKTIATRRLMVIRP